jgi:hypothetical protein
VSTSLVTSRCPAEKRYVPPKHIRGKCFRDVRNVGCTKQLGVI